jgi:protein-tyrosine phosphatase
MPEAFSAGEFEADPEADAESITEVLPWLYLGSLAYLSKNTSALSEHGITAMINASRGSIESLPAGTVEMRLFLRDKPSQDISSTFFLAIDFIERARTAGGKVLIYCHKGISRSATIVLAYLIWRNRSTYNKELAFLKDRRRKVSPNVGFCLQLISWSALRPSVVAAEQRPLVYRVVLTDERSFVLRYQDAQFAIHEQPFTGLIARVIQHEYDHIEGVLFIDKLSPLKKRLLKRKLTDITQGKASPSYRMKFPSLKSKK